MTDRQRALLDRRLQSAASQQAEILVLRDRLLKLGGDELVPPPAMDRDLPILVEYGSVMDGPVTSTPLEEGHCHENVAELWREKREEIAGIGVGYALSPDGLWREHSWGVRKSGEIIETTSARSTYFGRLLQGSEADEFAAANAGDPEERYWRRLPVVYFRLTKDEDGYPPEDWEKLKAEPINEGSYRIKNVPFYVRDVAYEDEVSTRPSEQGHLLFHSVSRRSGFSIVRLFINETEDRKVLADYLISRQCLAEIRGSLVAIAIPKASYEEVSRYIDDGVDCGRWGAEDGHIEIDD